MPQQYTDLPAGARRIVADLGYSDLPPGAVSVQAAPSVQPEQQGALSRFGSGLARTVLPSTTPSDYLEGPVYAAKHPLDSLKLLLSALGKAHGEQGKKTVGAAQEGRYSEALGHGLATILPAVGPAAAGAGEAIGSEDVAGGLGQAAGLLAPFGVGAIKKVAPPLQASARQNALSILRPGSKRNVPLAESIAGPLAKEKVIALTEKSLMGKVKAKKLETGPPAKAAYSGKPPVNIQPIFNDLEILRAQKAVVKGSKTVSSKPLNAAIDDIQAKLIDMSDALDRIPAETLDDFRDKLNKGLVDATGSYRAELAPQTVKAIDQGAARSIKRVLDGKHPDAKALNDSYHLWASAYDFLENARRATVASRSAVLTGSSKGFGALMQRMLPRPVREIPARIAGVFDSIAWNTVSGAAKQSVADAIAKAQWQKAQLLLAGLAGTNSALKEKPNGE
jgi:hypothetical protein